MNLGDGSGVSEVIDSSFQPFEAFYGRAAKLTAPLQFGVD